MLEFVQYLVYYHLCVVCRLASRYLYTHRKTVAITTLGLAGNCGSTRYMHFSLQSCWNPGYGEKLQNEQNANYLILFDLFVRFFVCDSTNIVGCRPRAVQACAFKWIHWKLIRYQLIASWWHWNLINGWDAKGRTLFVGIFVIAIHCWDSIEPKIGLQLTIDGYCKWYTCPRWLKQWVYI